MKKTIGMLLLAILLVNVVTACGKASERPVTPYEVTNVMDTTPVIPTPPACAPLPTDKSLVVEPISASAVCLSGEGFEPGKRLTVVLTSEVTSGTHHRRLVGWRYVGPVAADGRFTSTLDGLDPIYSAITNTWQVALIHDDSAVCRMVTLPSEE